MLAALNTRNIGLNLIFWWLAWILVQTIVLHRLSLTWNIALIDAIVTNLTLALAGYITQNTYKFYRPGNENRFFRLGYGLVLSLLSVFIINLLLSRINAQNATYLYFLKLSLPIRTMFALIMLAFVTVISWLWYYAKDKDESSKRKTEAEALLRAAELSKLRQQLQPHFLFNSLNSISALAGSKPAEARLMIQNLSDFLRGTLKKDDDQLVKLAEEINHLQLYLAIEKVRFGHRLQTVFTVVETCNNLQLPSLILQPVVENAIKFGLYDTIDDIVIEVKATCNDNFLIVEVNNPFDSNHIMQKNGTGFGLSSLQKRLQLLYGRHDLLTTSQQQNIFYTTIKIPQIV